MFSTNNQSTRSVRANLTCSEAFEASVLNGHLESVGWTVHGN